MRLFPFEGTTLHSTLGFLSDHAILFAVESKAEKHKRFGSKQGQHHSKPSGFTDGLPCWSSTCFTRTETGWCVVFFYPANNSTEWLTTGKGSSHMARAASSMDWKYKKKNVWRTWIWQDWVGFRQKLVTADSLVALFAPEEKGINDKHTHAVGKRLISRYQIKPANTAKGLACLQYASYNNGSMVITGTQGKQGKIICISKKVPLKPFDYFRKYENKHCFSKTILLNINSVKQAKKKAV